MSRVNLKALPHLIPPPATTVASDIERTPAEWAEAIARLRPCLQAFANIEM